MDDIELNHPRDSTFTLVRHAVMTSPRTIRLVTHLLVVATNFLTAFALAIVVVAFAATFIIQCFSVICVIEKFIECFNEVLISMGARMVSFLLLKSCFSRGTTDRDRDRMAAGRAVIRILVGCCWSSIAYSLPVSKLHAFYFSWPFFTIVICQIWLQLIIVRVEEMFRREQGGNNRESRKDRMTCSLFMMLPLSLLCCLISIKLSKNWELDSAIMLRNAINSLYEGAVVEKQIISLMGNESSSSAYAYEDSSSPSSSQHRKLTHEVVRLSFQLILDTAMIASTEDNRAFLAVLVATDTLALSDPLLRILDIVMYERQVRKKFPRLSAAEFLKVPKEETCPVCLECHTLRDTVKLPCGHLVHSSCVLNMARVAAASSRRYQAGLQYPLSTSARRCPICRASLSFDSSPAIASDGESESSPLVAPLPPIVSAPAAGNISNDGALGSVASPSVSLGSEMIRSTFGGRVLVALTNRQPSHLTAGNAVEGASNPGHVRALGDSFLVETQLPLLSTMRLASLSPIGVLQRQNGFRAGTRNLLNVSSANRNSSVEHVVGITMQAPAIVSSTPATTEQFAARDAALSEELDHWYPPVGVGAGIPSRPSNSSTLPAASSSFSQLEVVAAVPMAMITSTTVTPTDVDERRLSLTPLTRGNGLKKRKRESKSSVGIRARMARARTKDATSK